MRILKDKDFWIGFVVAYLIVSFWPAISLKGFMGGAIGGGKAGG